MDDGLIAWHATLEKGVTGIFPGVETITVTSGGHSYPEDPWVAGIVRRMSDMKAGELLIDDRDVKTLIVKYDYGDTAVAVSYKDGIAPADISRVIRLMLSGRGQRDCSKPYVPAADVERLSGRWKKSIAYVFGEKFALKLVEKSLSGMNRNEMTKEDLDAARAFISSALGDCLDLQKVNK